MQRFTLPACLLPQALLGGCVASGWRFGPVFRCTDGAMFSEPPVVVRRGGEYFLAWRQGTFEFAFFPTYKAMDGRLVFVLQGTSSSGSNLAGRRREMKIEGAQSVQ